MSQALADVRRNVDYYQGEVKAAQKRLADALEKHRYERERLEERLAEATARATDYQAILAVAEEALS